MVAMVYAVLQVSSWYFLTTALISATVDESGWHAVMDTMESAALEESSWSALMVASVSVALGFTVGFLGFSLAVWTNQLPDLFEVLAFCTCPALI